MGKGYDYEKERLVRIALSQDYTGPTEQIKEGSVEFNPSTRKATITYIIVKGKRNVDKSFSYNGVKYKIYSDWKYTDSQKKQSLYLTDEVLEELNQSSDSIIRIHLNKILKALPYEYYPSWAICNKIKEEFKEKFDKRVEEVSLPFDNKIKPTEMAINELQVKIETAAENVVKIREKKESLSSSIKNYQDEIERRSHFPLSLFSRGIICDYSDKVTEFRWSLSNLNKEEDNNKKIVDTFTPRLRKQKEALNKLYEEKKEAIKAIETEFNKMCQEEECKALAAAKQRKQVVSEISDGKATADFIKEERAKINRIYKDGKTLREFILIRDNYTCRKCGNSRTKEPNLLLEVDHITPVSKWGPSQPANLQTLCWKCNREKSDKT